MTDQQLAQFKKEIEEVIIRATEHLQPKAYYNELTSTSDIARLEQELQEIRVSMSSQT